jgi:hypothetical protein
VNRLRVWMFVVLRRSLWVDLDEVGVAVSLVVGD